MKGSGNIELEQEGDGTLIKYTGDLQLGGTIAGVGQRMIQGTAKMMASQFFTALEAEAQTAVGEAPPKHGFFRTALVVLRETPSDLEIGSDRLLEAFVGWHC